MLSLGYALSSEEHSASDLVQHAVSAEDAGFEFALISDHFHPWLDVQGQSSFVWSVLGAIATRTSTLSVGTGVTCPLMRFHPAIVAQAAATVATMMPGRFFLGVGTGENLNEHIIGQAWRPNDVRLEMLTEAVEVIRKLWTGKQIDYRGRFYTVDNARIYSRPEQAPAIMLAASSEDTARLASRIGDGLISTAPDEKVVEAFSESSRAKPRYGQVTVCWAESAAEAMDTAFKYWPTSALSGEITKELSLPAHFESACAPIRRDDVTETVACGPDPELHIAALRRYASAGFDHIYVHQIGPDQAGFFDFYRREILPRTHELGAEVSETELHNEVDMASAASFPASDPPSNGSSR